MSISKHYIGRKDTRTKRGDIDKTGKREILTHESYECSLTGKKRERTRGQGDMLNPKHRTGKRDVQLMKETGKRYKNMRIRFITLHKL